MEVINSLLPTDNIVIDSVNEEFYNAIQHLQKQDIIGLALEEPESDRYSTLEWLSVSTSMCTYIFDIQKLGKSAFLEGLKRVLENPLIVKIVHDCRRPSDCLYHIYDTKLSNVYDTQVADFVAHIQKENPSNVFKTVNNLYYCLTSYLQISEEIFHPSPIKSEYSLRPILYNVKDFLIKKVVYLRLLKKELDIVLRIPYRRCVDMYMQSIQRKSNGEMKLSPPDLGSVPPEMLIEGMQVFQITEQLPESNAFLPKKRISTYEDNSYMYGNIGDNLSKDFDRTEVIKFLMERMFYGRKLCNGTYAHSIESDQYSVKSMDVSSLCDPVCLTDCLSLEDKLVSSKKEDMLSKNSSLSSLSDIKKFTQTAKRQSDSKLLPFENQSESDTSIHNLSTAKRTDLVRHRKQKSVEQNVEEDPKNTSLFQNARNSTIYNTHSKHVNLEDKSQKLNEVHNSLIEKCTLESLDEENPISVITSKDISPFDKYKYVMSKRSKNSSKNSFISDSNDNFSSKDEETSNMTNACDNQNSGVPMSIIMSKDISPTDKYKYVMAKRSSVSSNNSLCNLRDNFSSRDSDKSNISNAYESHNSSKHLGNIPPFKNSSIEQTNVSVPEVTLNESITAEYDNKNVTDDPWELLRSAFDSLGPQRPIKKSILVPAGMNC